MEQEHERTAELLLELHASHQASHLQSSQLRQLRPMGINMEMPDDSGPYRGRERARPIEYTIEGEHDTIPSQPIWNGSPKHTINDRPHPNPIHPDDRVAIEQIGKNKEYLNEREEEIKVLKWTERTLYTGKKPPHPVILNLMEGFMTGQRAKRAESEPPTLPSAVKRITSLPVYGAGKEVQQRSGSGALVAGRVEALNAHSTIQRDIKNAKRSSARARASSRLNGKDANSNPSSKVASSSRALSPSHSHKPVTASESSYSHSQLVSKRQTPTHYCIRDGHHFELLTLNKPGSEGGRGRTENKIASRKFKCGKCGSKIDETKILMCKIPVCGVMVCGDCKREWEVINRGWLRRA